MRVVVGVALRKESVDRNRSYFPWPFLAAVALRKESVDRNKQCSSEVRGAYVALRKESVDRNPTKRVDIDVVKGSLSARRAWIEIS